MLRRQDLRSSLFWAGQVAAKAHRSATYSIVLNTLPLVPLDRKMQWCNGMTPSDVSLTGAVCKDGGGVWAVAP